MAYPDTLPVLTKPVAGGSRSGEAAEHSEAFAAVETLAARVGTGSSTPTSGKVLTGTGIGSSAWADPISAAIAGIFDVTAPAYGAVGDDSTDDQAAIQLALDVADAAGGGTVWLPAGLTFLLTALAVASQAHLHNPYSNVHMEGGPGATLHASDAYSIIYQGSTTKFVDQTVYTLASSVARGATSITCNTHADAGNFTAGDWLYLRSGQTVDGLVGQPDAEINRVVSANASTGVITLAWPTSKPYAQEYFISGTAGKTSTSSTAHLAAFGVSKITSLMTTNQSYRGIHFLHTGTGDTGYAMIGGQVVGCLVDRCTGAFLKGGFQSVGAHRFYTVRDCRFDHQGVSGTYPYTLTTDSGCTDTIWQGNYLTGSHIISAHIHEGATRTAVLGNTWVFPDTGSDISAIDVRSRAYDISIIGNLISGGGLTTITVDPDCVGGGVIANNQIMGLSNFSIAVAAPNWMVSGNRTPYGASPYAVGKYGVDTDMRVLEAWVDKDNLTVPLGILPPNSFVDSITYQVTTAFNGSGTDTISVGFSADHTGFAAATDVSTTGIKTPTLGGYAGYTATGYYAPLTAYYVAGAGAPSAGKALVIVRYFMAPQWP